MVEASACVGTAARLRQPVEPADSQITGLLSLRCVQAEERHGSIEERMRHLECQLEEKNQELLRVSLSRFYEEVRLQNIF